MADLSSRWDLDRKFRLEFQKETAGLTVRELFVFDGLFEFVNDW